MKIQQDMAQRDAHVYKPRASPGITPQKMSMVRDNQSQPQGGAMFANMPMQPIPAPPNSVALPPGSIMTSNGQVLQPAHPAPYPPAPPPAPYAPYPPYQPGYGACSGAQRSSPGACGNCPSCRSRGFR